MKPRSWFLELAAFAATIAALVMLGLSLAGCSVEDAPLIGHQYACDASVVCDRVQYTTQALAPICAESEDAAADYFVDVVPDVFDCDITSIRVACARYGRVCLTPETR